MKNVIIFFTVLLAINLNAQQVEEPEFIGESIVIKPDGTSVLLEKTISQVRTAAGASVYIVGIGSAKTKLQINGCCAANKFKTGEDFQIIIKADDNKADPLSIIKIFRFDSTKKYRRAELSSANTFGTVKTNKLAYIPFTGKKYGESSYLINLKEKPVGEFGIMISNPNNLDEKNAVVSTFAIVE